MAGGCAADSGVRHPLRPTGDDPGHADGRVVRGARSRGGRSAGAAGREKSAGRAGGGTGGVCGVVRGLRALGGQWRGGIILTHHPNSLAFSGGGIIVLVTSSS